MHRMFSFPSLKASLNLFHSRNCLTMCKCVILPRAKSARIGITSHAKPGSTASTPMGCSQHRFPLHLEYMERIEELLLFPDSMPFFKLSLLNMHFLERVSYVLTLFPREDSLSFEQNWVVIVIKYTYLKSFLFLQK